MRTFFIRLLNWEYWPQWVVYFPVNFYYAYLAIKARSLFFFSAANPGIETGGMFFESKWKIFELIPKKYLPSTILIHPEDTEFDIVDKMALNEITYPIIAKPDRGERGWGVQKINSFDELKSYRQFVHVDFVIQSYVDKPIELSVFYYRHPQSPRGIVTSITLKELLRITGDGTSSIETLIRQNNRAYLQEKKLKKNHKINFNQVLKKGESLELVPYGNHVLGAMFLNYTQLIDQQISSVFNDISLQIDGFYFGRYDLRCESLDDLKTGNNISIMELNGAGAEPAHIYDPAFSYIKAQVILARHFRMMYEAAIENRKTGTAFMSLKEYKHMRRLEKQYKNCMVSS